MTNWPTEEWIQQACLDDCLVKYNSYQDWWNNHSSGISRLIRKLFVEDFVGSRVSWEEYEEQYERQSNFETVLEVTSEEDEAWKEMERK